MSKPILAALALAATAAVAQTADRGPNNDPNQIVCVKEREIGSRLAVRKICRTRAEWGQLREQTRRVVERVQFEKVTGNQ